jgi:DNA ligase-associated metallophosphoesterase
VSGITPDANARTRPAPDRPAIDGTRVIEFAGESVHLLPDRAAFLPALDMLVVADVHLGKAQVLRRHGIPVPRGSTGGDLARLDRLIARTGCTRLLVLGDLVHAPGDTQAPWRARLAQWRAHWRDVEMKVVAGNHDRGEDLAAMGFAPVGDRWRYGAIEFAHAPATKADAATHARVCGHVHPVAVRSDAVGRLRMPVFWVGARQLVLPAFGALTGGFRIQPASGDRLFVAGGNEVFPLP